MDLNLLALGQSSRTIGILKKIPSLVGAHHRTTFSCTRKRKSGEHHLVSVIIDEAGPDSKPGLRYVVQDHSEDSKATSGNEGSTIEDALAKVHWWELDRQVRHRRLLIVNVKAAILQAKGYSART